MLKFFFFYQVNTSIWCFSTFLILEVVLLLKYLTVILFCVHTEFMHAAPNLRDHPVGIFLTWREQNVFILRHRWYRTVFIERRKSIYLSCIVLNRRVHECLSSAETCLLSTRNMTEHVTLQVWFGGCQSIFPRGSPQPLLFTAQTESQYSTYHILTGRSRDPLSSFPEQDNIIYLWLHCSKRFFLICCFNSNILRPTGFDKILIGCFCTTELSFKFPHS